ncbi:LPXTG cell wall anchor domain-containing protein [Actinosynnema sp. NPDC023794]
MQFARAVRASLCVAAAVASAGLLAAVPASAHTPSLKSGCLDGNAVLTVGLTRYDGRRSNSVTVEDNGRSVEDGRFRESFRKSYTEPGTVEHVFTVTVRAWDDPRWERGWSFTRRLTVPACVTPTTTITTTAVPVTTTTVTTATPVETTTTTTTTTTPLTFDWPTTQRKALVVPAANDSGLPDTGADVTVPLVLGVLLLSGGTVVLFVLRRRLRR